MHYWHVMHLSLLSSDYCLPVHYYVGVTSALVKTQTQRVHCLLYVFIRGTTCRLLCSTCGMKVICGVLVQQPTTLHRY